MLVQLFLKILIQLFLKILITFFLLNSVWWTFVVLDDAIMGYDGSKVLTSIYP